MQSTPIRLAVLFGGVSGEHDVSCLSAASILAHLDPQRYVVTPIGISRSGRWFLQPPWNGKPLVVVEDASKEVVVWPGKGLASNGTILSLDAVFPIAHGIRGEDGALQGLLEWAQLPYAGAKVTASALGMDKEFAKQIWQKAGLPVVPSMTLRRGEASLSNLSALYSQAVKTLGTPLFVKPVNSGSSVGVTKVETEESWKQALEKAFSVDRKVLIETAVSAREIEVAVMGGDRPQAYGPGEIAPNHEFYDYEAKYIDPDGAALLVPAPLEVSVRDRIFSLAVEAYRLLDTQGFARVDFFVDKKTGELWINEINTLPGFTTISMFPRMAMTSGRSYGQILDDIIDQALNK